MPSFRASFAFAALGLLALEAIAVWRPFDVSAALYTTPFRANQPTGELVDGFRVTQEIPTRLVQARTRNPLSKRRTIHWHGPPHSLKTLLEPANCFSLHFATYNRSNDGQIQVSWRQGGTAQSWLVEAEDLVDNAFVDFCPRNGIGTHQSSQVTVQGVGGKPGNSATLWLTRSNLHPASVQGSNVGDRSLSVQMTYLRRVTASDIAVVGKGAFLLACLCSLAVAFLALWRALRELSGPDPLTAESS